MLEFEEMTVKELIERLADLAPEFSVRIAYDGGVHRSKMKVYSDSDYSIAIIEVPS